MKVLGAFGDYGARVILRGWGPAVLSLLVLELAPVSAGAQTTACSSGAPAVAFSSGPPITVPVGAGSALAPSIEATCGGVPLAEPQVTVTLTSASGQMFLGGVYDLAGSDTAGDVMNGNDEGVVTVPIITGGVTDGPFSLQASFDGATTIVNGDVVGSLKALENPQHALATYRLPYPSCSGIKDRSNECLNGSVAVLNAGRKSEKLGPLVLPSNWKQLSIPTQLFVLTDLERTARGLPPISGLAADWNAIAQQGANVGRDPIGVAPWTPFRTSSDPAIDGPQGGFGELGIEDPSTSNAIQAMVAWVYTDGIYPNGSTGDADCTRADPQNCWGHREAVLEDSPFGSCQLECVMGAADSPTGYHGSPAYTEIFPLFAGNNGDPVVTSWTSELGALPRCERTGDTCSWAHRPLARFPSQHRHRRR
jgi:hypothetical protein